jgi:hypothetical protein
VVKVGVLDQVRKAKGEMSIKRKILVVSLVVLLLVAILLQSWNIDNLANNKWLENGIDIVLAITVILAVSTTPKNSN